MLICRSSHKHFIAKKQSEIELMMEENCKKEEQFYGGRLSSSTSSRRGVLEMELESVMKLNGLT